MQQIINVNAGVISSQGVKAQAAELDLDRDWKQEAKIIVIEKFKELINKR